MSDDTHPADKEKTKIGKDQYKQSRATAAKKNAKAARKILDTVTYPDKK